MLAPVPAARATRGPARRAHARAPRHGPAGAQGVGTLRRIWLIRRLPDGPKYRGARHVAEQQHGPAGDHSIQQATCLRPTAATTNPCSAPQSPTRWPPPPSAPERRARWPESPSSASTRRSPTRWSEPSPSALARTPSAARRERAQIGPVDPTYSLPRLPPRVPRSPHRGELQRLPGHREVTYVI